MQLSSKASSPAAETAAPVTSTPAKGFALNGRGTHSFPRRAIVQQSVPQPEPPRPVEVIDPKLGENDVRLNITVTINGRTKMFMDGCEFGTTIYEGLRHESRGRFFQNLARLLEEVQEAVAVKVNTALSMTATAPDPEHNDDGAPQNGAIKRPFPPFEEADAEAVREFLRIHVPPPLNSH